MNTKRDPTQEEKDLHELYQLVERNGWQVRHEVNLNSYDRRKLSLYANGKEYIETARVFSDNSTELVLLTKAVNQARGL